MPLERKNVLIQIAHERLKDATVLLKQKRYNGAVYLGSYVIECLLKAAICVQLRRDRLPAEYKTHELDALLRSSGLFAPLSAERSIYRHYHRVKTWSVELRYLGKRYATAEAKQFLVAVKEVRQWILSKLSS